MFIGAAWVISLGLDVVTVELFSCFEQAVTVAIRQAKVNIDKRDVSNILFSYPIFKLLTEEFNTL